jgi:hypothetical protein
MKNVVDYDATISHFLATAISWLKNRPVRPRDGVDKEQISYNYMKKVQSDPRKYTANNATYANSAELEGFIECTVDKNNNQKKNNDLYFAVLEVLDAMGEYYKNECRYTKIQLLEKIKDFQVALNRKNFLKSIYYKMQMPSYFAQKQK